MPAPEAAGWRLREQPFEAVFADTAAPNLSRAGFTRVTRNSKLNSQTPIVFLTGLGGPAAAPEGAPPGVSVMAKVALHVELPLFLRVLKKKLTTERRKGRRLSFRTRVNCLQGAARFRATSADLASAGMLFEAGFPLQLNAEVELSFSLAPGEPAFQARARVVRVDSSGRVGVAFQKISNPDRERLRQFLNLHLPAAG